MPAPLTLGHASLTVQHADPRRLFVQAQVAQLSFLFIVLHTPCLQAQVPGQPAPLDALTDWWQETAALMAKFRTDTLMWLLIDANSPLSAGNNDLVGPVGAEPMTKQGELFYHFLQNSQFGSAMYLSPPAHWPVHHVDTHQWPQKPQGLCATPCFWLVPRQSFMGCSWSRQQLCPRGPSPSCDIISKDGWRFMWMTMQPFTRSSFWCWHNNTLPSPKQRNGWFSSLTRPYRLSHSSATF